MKELFENQYLILAMTFAIFYYFRRLQYRTGWLLLNPILIAIVVLIAYLKLTGVSFETFEESGSLIDFWLKPAVVALGVPLYLQFEAIKKLWLPIVLSQLVGCLVGIVSVVLIAQFFGASQVVILSLASKSVTTPIAMEVTQTLGGIPSLTAAVVVITGILGAIMGFKTLAMGHVNSPIHRAYQWGLHLTPSGHQQRWDEAINMGLLPAWVLR